MIRLLGVNLSSRKKILIALTNIYGIGISRSRTLLKTLSINENLKVSELTQFQINLIKSKLETETALEGELKRSISEDIKRLIEIKSFRGRRHLSGLPARGQRTRTNSKTCKKIRKH